MRKDKWTRAMTQYDGWHGAATINHVMSTIPADLCAELTGKQIGRIMSIRNAAYHEGIKSGEQHNDTDGCVLTDAGLIPLDIVRQIKITKCTIPGEWRAMTGRMGGGGIRIRWAKSKETITTMEYHNCPIDGSVEYEGHPTYITEYTLQAQEQA
jgi:hypothetical protein